MGLRRKVNQIIMLTVCRKSSCCTITKNVMRSIGDMMMTTIAIAVYYGGMLIRFHLYVVLICSCMCVCVCADFSSKKKRRSNNNNNQQEKKTHFLFNQNKSEFNQYIALTLIFYTYVFYWMLFFLFFSLSLCYLIVQFKSIQMIDSDNWPWLACSSQSLLCGRRHDRFFFFSSTQKCINATFRFAGWLFS